MGSSRAPRSGVHSAWPLGSSGWTNPRTRTGSDPVARRIFQRVKPTNELPSWATALDFGAVSDAGAGRLSRKAGFHRLRVRISSGGWARATVALSRVKIVAVFIRVLLS